MGIQNQRGQFIRPKATVRRTIPQDLINKISNLLTTYKSIPLLQFTAIFHYTYKQVFDAASMGFKDGLFGFFSQLDMIDLQETEDGFICSLKDPEMNATTQERFLKLVMDKNRRRQSRGIFNPENQTLWSMDTNNLLSTCIEDLTLAKSHLEQLLSVKPDRVKCEIEKVHSVMFKFPNGIRLSNICKYVVIDKKLFNLPSIFDIINECPELFYCIQSDEDEWVEPIVFDGATRTIEDLTGSNIKASGVDAVAIARESIETGVYQKTLMLIQKAGVEGLKVGVWYPSITYERNFKQNDVGPNIKEKHEKFILNTSPLTFFLSLASLGLVEIRSHTMSRNDLRVHIPKCDIDKNINNILHN